MALIHNFTEIEGPAKTVEAEPEMSPMGEGPDTRCSMVDHFPELDSRVGPQ